MYKPPENNQLVELKSHSNRSHNLDSKINAFVEMFARQVADTENKLRLTTANHHKIEGEEL